jgi:hypothetical protein
VYSSKLNVLQQELRLAGHSSYTSDKLRNLDSRAELEKLRSGDRLGSDAAHRRADDRRDGELDAPYFAGDCGNLCLAKGWRLIPTTQTSGPAAASA